ncbi:MAG: hypothetical protein JO208_12025 [Alphaproteobacteria bacterium]|nr:hypothetical protein [Alphaproteobacteria bacterium]
MFKLAPDGHETILSTYYNSTVGGGHPEGTLLKGANGYLYNTTSAGARYGAGSFIEHWPDGHTAVVDFNFPEKDGSPYAGVIADPSGNFYAVGAGIGAHHHFGAVYKISP